MDWSYLHNTPTQIKGIVEWLAEMVGGSLGTVRIIGVLAALTLAILIAPYGIRVLKRWDCWDILGKAPKKDKNGKGRLF